MIVFLSVIFSTTTASVESMYLKEVSVIASVDSATRFNDSLPGSLLAPYAVSYTHLTLPTNREV